MDLVQLRTFLLAAELHSFTQAARRLNFSQSAVSQQIRELEERLGVRLFERHARSVSLTPAGERLRPLARKLVQDAEAAVEALDEFRGTLQGVLRIGAGHTVGVYILPYLLGRFSERFPGVRASLQVADDETLSRAMQDGELDLVLTETEVLPGRVFGWEKLPALDDELILIGPPGHPWRSPDPDTVLSTAPMILRQQDSPIRHLVASHLTNMGVNPARMRTRFELGNTEGIKRAIMAGLGLGWVSRFAIASELASGQLEALPLPGLRVRRTIWLMLPLKKRTPLQTTFSEILRDGDWWPTGIQLPPLTTPSL